jgi:hypothetical protein
MTGIEENAVDNLRSGNVKLATLTRDAIYKAAQKASQFIGESEDSNDLLTNIKVLETATKMVGLTPKESSLNVQINHVTGFDFIEVDSEEIAQLQYDDSYEAEYED